MPRSRSKRIPQRPARGTYAGLPLIVYAGSQVYAARRRSACFSTMQKLGEAVGVAPTVIARLERGQSWPSIDKLLHIAEVLDLPYTHLFPDTLDPEMRTLLTRVAEHRQLLPALLAILDFADHVHGLPQYS